MTEQEIVVDQAGRLELTDPELASAVGDVGAAAPVGGEKQQPGLDDAHEAALDDAQQTAVDDARQAALDEKVQHEAEEDVVLEARERAAAAEPPEGGALT